MAAIKSIQNGVATVSAAAQSTTASITAVDLTKTVLFFGLRKNNNNQQRRDFFVGSFNSTTELFWARQEAAGNETIIEWYVVEWDSGVTVQSGLHTGQEDTTITEVVLANAFVVHTHEMNGTILDGGTLIKSWLSTTTNLRMEDDDTTIDENASNAWFVVESTDFSVERGSLALTGTTADQTIFAVTLAQTFPIIS